MPTIEGHVATDRASRYLQQVCSHASLMRHSHGDAEAEATSGGTNGAISDTTDHTAGPTTGRITRGTARCDLTADPAGLTLVVTSDDEAQLRALQEAVTRTLERAGRREGLTVLWG